MLRLSLGDAKSVGKGHPDACADALFLVAGSIVARCLLTLKDKSRPNVVYPNVFLHVGLALVEANALKVLASMFRADSFFCHLWTEGFDPYYVGIGLV